MCGIRDEMDGNKSGSNTKCTGLPNKKDFAKSAEAKRYREAKMRIQCHFEKQFQSATFKDCHSYYMKL